MPARTGLALFIHRAVRLIRRIALKIRGLTFSAACPDVTLVIPRVGHLDAFYDLSLYCRMLSTKQAFRGLAALMVLLGCATVMACSSKDLRYPADHARLLRIDAAMETLRRAYVEKDLPDIQAIMLPLDPLERLQIDISKDFQSFQEISLDFAIDRIIIEGDTIDVFVHWQGQWKRALADTPITERGHGMLRWVGIHSILLSNVDGDLPFGMALRHTEPEPRPNSPA